MVKYLTKSGIILIIFVTMVTACDVAPSASQAQSKLSPCENAQVQSDQNFYQKKSLTPPSGSIFSRAYPSDIDPSSNSIDIRREALNILKDQLARWTDHQDILVADNRILRFTLTYISPELVEIIFLNQKLSDTPINRLTFNDELRIQLESLAKQDELYFLLTITDSYYTPLIKENDVVNVKIPIENIMLINSDNEYSTYKHIDSPLGQNINISRKHLSGYITFPMSVQKNETCKLMINPNSNMTITVIATGVNVTTNSAFEIAGDYQLNWSFKYRALMDMGILPPSSSINPNSTPEFLRTPPIPDINIAEPPDLYWEDMARYVWAYVVDP